MSRLNVKKARKSWSDWLRFYIDKKGAEAVFDALIRSIQGAQSKCIYCHQVIECDIVEGGGVPDWKTRDGDYGCGSHPNNNEDGCWGHVPIGVNEKIANGGTK